MFSLFKKSKPSKYNQVAKLSIIRSTAILVILFIFGTTLCIFNLIINEGTDIENSMFTSLSERDAEYILLLKKNLDLSISDDTKQIALNIENDIKETINLDELQGQMDKGIYSKELENIFANHIKSNNNIMICNKDGIITDYNLSRATEDRSWEAEINNQYNKELAKTTIKNILNQNTDSILVFESTKSKEEGHKYLSSLTEDDIIEIYLNEGIDGLKNYVFVVPAYITDKGDIFGKNDIFQGHKQNTNKIIVLQVYNLYDHIKDYNIDKLLKNESLEDKLSSYKSSLYIYGIIYIISIISTMIFIFLLSNAIYYRDHTDKIKNNTLINYDITPDQIKEVSDKEGDEEEV